MANIEWNKVENRTYKTGVEQVALVKNAISGGKYKYSWDGVSAINENPSGAEPTKIWADDRIYLTLVSKEEFAFTLEAYKAIKEFNECDGKIQLASTGFGSKILVTGQERKSFGIIYRTLTGDAENEAGGANGGFVYHFIYGAKASPASKDHTTINDSPEATTMSWECSTTPVQETYSGVKYEYSHLEIPSSKITNVSYFESVIYEDTTAMPTIATILTAATHT